jgi:hypothetical protein
LASLFPRILFSLNPDNGEAIDRKDPDPPDMFSE